MGIVIVMETMRRGSETVPEQHPWILVVFRCLAH